MKGACSSTAGGSTRATRMATSSIGRGTWMRTSSAIGRDARKAFTPTARSLAAV